MTVSVVMATYNGEDYIEKQLESILNQSRLPEEIIICDDCSKDNTLQIIRKFVEKHNEIKWIVVKNNKNQGYIINFFNAIGKATGEIIILSDQDDVWDKNKIKFFVKCFNEHEDMLSIHSDYSIIDSNENIIGNNQIGYQKEIEKYSIQKFCERLNYCGMSSAFRSNLKEVLKDIDPNDIPTHDWTIHALSIVRDGMYVSNKITSFRRYTGSNVALNIDSKTKRSGICQRISVVKDYYNHYCMLSEFAKEISTASEIQYVNGLMEIQKIRLNYLKNRSLKRWIFNMRNISKYPSKKAYVCDGLYIIGIF